MDKTDFENFFKPYAQNVDNANRIGFWKLSDVIIMKIIEDNIPDGKELVLLDAGGGTGRWICALSEKRQSKFILYDLSSDMLERAQVNIANAGISKRVQIIEGDLTNMKQISSNSVDHVISIYSPISFVYEKDKAFKELYRILKPNGKILIMGHGFYNALFSKITNYTAKPEELHELDDKKMVKWAPHVPKLNVFSKNIMEDDLQRAGFIIKKTYGVPVFVQPGPEDFDPQNSKISKISQALEDRDFFKTIFDLEMKYNSHPTVANRGMNIFTLAIKGH